jgi:hypothetical protein
MPKQSSLLKSANMRAREGLEREGKGCDRSGAEVPVMAEEEPSPLLVEVTTNTPEAPLSPPVALTAPSSLPSSSVGGLTAAKSGDVSAEGVKPVADTSAGLSMGSSPARATCEKKNKNLI